MCASWKRGIESFLCFLIGYGVVPMGFLLARHCQAVPVSRSRPLLLRYSGRGRLLLSKELRLVRWGLCFFCSSLECATVSSRLAFGLALYVLRMNVAIKNTTFFALPKDAQSLLNTYCRHEQKKAKLNEGWNVLFLLAFFRAVRRVSLIRSDDKLFLCLPSTKKELSWLHSIKQLLITNNFTHQFITLVISKTLFPN